MTQAYNAAKFGDELQKICRFKARRRTLSKCNENVYNREAENETRLILQIHDNIVESRK